MSLAIAISLSVPGEVVPRFTPVEEFIVHAAAFGVAFGLWAAVWTRSPWRLLAVGLGMAVLTELLQGWVVPLRTASLTDALANGVGVVCAVAYPLWTRLRRPPEADSVR